jgi:hypothetical protein
MLTLILLFSASTARATLAPEQIVLEHLNACKAQLKASQDFGQQTRALEGFKSWLAGDARKLTAANPESTRKLRMTLAGLKIYLEPVLVSEAAQGHCTQIKEKILDSVDPRRRPPAYLPGEAQEALNLVDLLCVGRTRG